MNLVSIGSIFILFALANLKGEPAVVKRERNFQPKDKRDYSRFKEHKGIIICSHLRRLMTNILMTNKVTLNGTMPQRVLVLLL
jgi:hypothetical protein